MESNLVAYTLMPEPNSTYLIKIKDFPVIADPMSSSTTGFLMILSVLQYQAPYMPPTYSGAAGQAGKAAFIESGGQAMQDKVTSKIETEAKGMAHSMGLTDSEMGVVFGVAKIARDKSASFKLPTMGLCDSINNTLTTNSYKLNLQWKLP